MTASQDWLDGVPQPLRDAIAKGVHHGGSGTPQALVSAAGDLFEQVASGDGTRADALSLLAADALLTHAFAAQAARVPDGIPGLAARALARLERLGDGIAKP